MNKEDVLHKHEGVSQRLDNENDIGPENPQNGEESIV